MAETANPLTPILSCNPPLSSTTQLAAMFHNTGPDFTDLTTFSESNNNNFDCGSSGATGDLFHMESNLGNQYVGPSTGDEWYLQSLEDGDPSQPYTGVETMEGLNGFPYPATSQSLCQGNNASEGKSRSPTSETSFKSPLLPHCRVLLTLLHEQPHRPPLYSSLPVRL